MVSHYPRRVCVSSAELFVSKATCWTPHLLSVTLRGWTGPQSSSEHLDSVPAPWRPPPVTRWPAPSIKGRSQLPKDLKVRLPFTVVFLHLSESLWRLRGERKPGFRGQDEPIRAQWGGGGEGEGRGKDSGGKSKQAAFLSKSVSTGLIG